MKRPAKRRRAGRGILAFLALVLLSSGALRIADSAGQAFAGDVVAAAADEPRHALATAARAVFDPDGIARLLQELNDREAELDRREQAIEARMQDLDAAEATLKENLSALVAAEERLRATLALADGAMEKDIARLTRVYETMKPKDAAMLFEQMDPTFAAGFLARMAPEAAAGIMAGLSTEAAYSISIIVAGRHRDVPKQ